MRFFSLLLIIGPNELVIAAKIYLPFAWIETRVLYVPRQVCHPLGNSWKHVIDRSCSGFSTICSKELRGMEYLFIQLESSTISLKTSNSLKKSTCFGSIPTVSVISDSLPGQIVDLIDPDLSQTLLIKVYLNVAYT